MLWFVWQTYLEQQVSAYYMYYNHVHSTAYNELRPPCLQCPPRAPQLCSPLGSIGQSAVPPGSSH